MSRIAIVDLLFNWPPDGGARTDVKEIALRLSKEHDVAIFVPNFEHYNFPRGRLLSKLPLQIERVPFNPEGFHRFQVCSGLKEGVDKYNPHFVFITDGWYLKPYVVNALREYNPILRFYAYETLCLRSHGHLYIDGKICNKNYLKGSLECIFSCIGCALRWIKETPDEKFVHESRISFALFPTYCNLVKRAIKNARKIIVYNEFIKDRISFLNKNVMIAPSGVDTKLFKPGNSSPSKKMKILMVGRAEDDLKGFPVLRQACQKLHSEKYNFQLLLTTDIKFQEDYITSVGWLTPEDLAQLYREVDICVVPSVWPEPFGIVALEAMASAKPVIVTKVGGLQKVLENDKEGFIVEPQNVDELVLRLKQLLENPQLRKRMGQAARSKVERDYDWDIIYEKYYRHLFSGKKN